MGGRVNSGYDFSLLHLPIGPLKMNFCNQNTISYKPPNRYLIAGVGEILWDVLPDGARLGGAPANFAYYAQILGAEGIIISRVGRDKEGEKILSLLRSAGLKTDFISIDPEHPTGKAVVRVDKRGRPSFEILNNAAWDYLEMDKEMTSLAKKADAVAFGSLAQRSPISRKTINEFLSLVKGNCLRVFDVNLRIPYYKPDYIPLLINKTDILKMNEKEWRSISQLFSKNQNKIIDHIFSSYPVKIIVVTRGEKGSILFSRNESIETKAQSASVIDTVGAGDAFAATVAVGFLRQKSLAEIAEKANQIAALVCSQKGAWVSLPTEVLLW